VNGFYCRDNCTGAGKKQSLDAQSKTKLLLSFLGIRALHFCQFLCDTLCMKVKISKKLFQLIAFFLAP